MTLEDNNSIKVNRILFFIGLFLFAYTASRAYLLSFTWDESFTYVEFIKTKFIFTFKEHKISDANNHILNTWLMELCAKLFGISEFTLRLPNVIAHLVFLFYSAKLVRNLSSRVLTIGSFLLLNISPLLLDFFSLARGYGMSMALMMGSLYYAYEYISQKKSYHSAFYSVLFASFGLLSYFILLNYLLIISFLFIIVYFIRNRRITDEHKFGEAGFQVKRILIILSPLVILLYALPIMLQLKGSNAFAFGEQQGFWHDTVCSLISQTLYEGNAIGFALFGVQIGIVIILIASIMIIVLSLKNKIHNEPFLSFIFLVLFLCLIANFIQHKWIGILFLQGRYALYYYLLFMVLMIFLFDNLINSKLKNISQWIFLTIVLLFLVNFFNAANLHYTNNWKIECDIRDMLNDVIIIKNTESPEINPIYIFGSKTFEKDFYFYNDHPHGRQIRLETYENSNIQMFDCYYVESPDLSNYPFPDYKIVKEYPASNTYLLSFGHEFKQKEIYIKKINFEQHDSSNRFYHLSKETAHSGLYSSKTDADNNYSDGYSYIIDDSLLNNKSASVIFKAMIKSKILNPDANIVISFENSSSSISYQALNLKNCIPKVNEWTPVYFRAFVPKEIKKGDMIKAYLWNISKHIIYIDDMELKIIAYEK